jgi:Ras-related protein Rab-8A
MSIRGLDELVPPSKRIKVLLMGGPNSGKTSALLKHCDDVFSNNNTYIPTIGVDFKVKFTQLSDGRKYKAQIWDTAGQERFRTITYAYLRGAAGVFLFYNVSNRKSFELVSALLPEICTRMPNSSALMLVGTNVDGGRAITHAEGSSLAQSINKPHGIPFYEISSKSNYKVDVAFEHMYEMAAKLMPCRYASIIPTPWTTELHPLCVKDQKKIFKTMLLYFHSLHECKLPNDVMLYIFQFLRAAEHDLEWYKW